MIAHDLDRCLLADDYGNQWLLWCPSWWQFWRWFLWLVWGRWHERWEVARLGTETGAVTARMIWVGKSTPGRGWYEFREPY